jgi:hypothetical protein
MLALGRRDRRTPLALVLAAAALALFTTAAATPGGPSIRHDFAYPTILVVGRTFYAYSTASRYDSRVLHVPVTSSASPTGGWGRVRDGKHYLLYSAGSRGNDTIWLQRVNGAGTRTIGPRRPMVRADRPDEAHIVEAPTLIRHGDRYVLPPATLTTAARTSSTTRMVFHAYTGPTTRAMFVAGLRWTTRDTPVLRGNALARTHLDTR